MRIFRHLAAGVRDAVVFGAGVFYIFRLMRRRPDAGDEQLDDAPTRAAGITPAQQIEAGGSHGV